MWELVASPRVGVKIDKARWRHTVPQSTAA